MTIGYTIRYQILITVVTVLLFFFLLVFTLVTITNSDDNNSYAKKKKITSQSDIDQISSDDNNNNVNLDFQQTLRSTSSKLAILTFGDIHKSQFITAKPILDQYGFKGSFFVTCNMVGKNSNMDWQDLETLYSEGHDVEAKGEKDLNSLSSDNLDFQVSQSKNCLLEHGITPVTTFAVPHGNAVNNYTVINAIAKYYDMAINGFSNLMLLDCNVVKKQQLQQHELHGGGITGTLSSTDHQQNDCKTYSADGRLTTVNRYSIREWSHNANDRKFDYNSSAIFDKFVKVVNSQSKYNDNKDGIIDAIPLVAYHSIDNDRTTSSTDIDLFAAEMKYLYDNGFKVITMKDIGYDEMSNRLYVKRV
jgi:hypothetical protein